MSDRGWKQFERGGCRDMGVERQRAPAGTAIPRAALCVASPPVPDTTTDLPPNLFNALVNMWADILVADYMARPRLPTDVQSAQPQTSAVHR
jgi:hypothetical protein